jgi:ABC-type phosphate transport system substrate-binding protein
VFIKNILFFLLFIVILLLSPAAYSVNVITNTDVGVNTLTKAQLRRIYSMRQLRWANNKIITVFVLPSSNPLHQKFSKQKLKMFPYKLDRIWNKLIYSGLGTAPIVVDSEKALLDAVIKTSGAIGYVSDLKEVKDAYVIKISG